jgi:hypothetical protein
VEAATGVEVITEVLPTPGAAPFMAVDTVLPGADMRDAAMDIVRYPAGLSHGWRSAEASIEAQRWEPRQPERTGTMAATITTAAIGTVMEIWFARSRTAIDRNSCTFGTPGNVEDAAANQRRLLRESMAEIDAS